MKRFEIRPEWAESIQAHVDRAPELSPAQIDKLAVLLRPPLKPPAPVRDSKEASRESA